MECGGGGWHMHFKYCWVLLSNQNLNFNDTKWNRWRCSSELLEEHPTIISRQNSTSVKSECCSVWKCTITHLLNVDPSNPLPHPFHLLLFKFEDLVADIYCALQLWFTNGFIGYKGHILWFLKNRRYCCVSYQYNEYFK